MLTDSALKGAGYECDDAKRALLGAVKILKKTIPVAARQAQVNVPNHRKDTRPRTQQTKIHYNAVSNYQECASYRDTLVYVPVNRPDIVTYIYKTGVNCIISYCSSPARLHALCGNLRNRYETKSSQQANCKQYLGHH